MKVLGKLLASDIKQFFRERSALFWTFAFPIFFILIFGAVFSGGDNVTFNVGLVVEDNSPAAQQLSGMLQQVPVFKLDIGNQSAELQALKNGDRRAVIIVPSGFGQTILLGGNATVDVYYDPTKTLLCKCYCLSSHRYWKGLGSQRHSSMLIQ